MSTGSDCFISSFPNCMRSFSCLIALARTSVHCWIKVMRADTFALFLGGKNSVFHYDVICRVFIDTLYQVKAEKAMAPHSSTPAWKIPWTEEPGWLHSMGSLRVGYDWATSLSLFTFMHWRRKGQPTPVFLPGESQGRGSLVGCRLWGLTDSDTTEVT